MTVDPPTPMPSAMALAGMDRLASRLGIAYADLERVYQAGWYEGAAHAYGHCADLAEEAQR